MFDTIKAYLENNFLFEFGDDVDSDTNLFEAGLIDSFGFVELITFLEGEFKVKFEKHEMLGGNFASLDKIFAAVGNKCA